MFFKTFNELCIQLSPELQKTTLSFYSGWPALQKLNDVLASDWDKNLLYGQLRHGVHRMDIQLKSQNTLIKGIYSRGQKKMISLICYLSCLHVMDQFSNNQSILCLDDFDAELDHINADHFFTYLTTLPNQIIISTVESSRYSDKKVNMFHVEH